MIEHEDKLIALYDAQPVGAEGLASNTKVMEAIGRAYRKHQPNAKNTEILGWLLRARKGGKLKNKSDGSDAQRTWKKKRDPGFYADEVIDNTFRIQVEITVTPLMLVYSCVKRDKIPLSRQEVYTYISKIYVRMVRRYQPRNILGHEPLTD